MEDYLSCDYCGEIVTEIEGRFTKMIKRFSILCNECQRDISLGDLL